MISTEHLIGLAGIAIASSLLSTATHVAVDLMVPPAIEGTAIAPEEVAPNQIVSIQWNLIKRTGCPGENSRIWNGVDGFVLRGPLGKTSLPVTDEPKVYLVPTRIPAYAPAGPITLSIDGYYACPGQPKEYFTLGPVKMMVVNPETETQ